MQLSRFRIAREQQYPGWFMRPYDFTTPEYSATVKACCGTPCRETLVGRTRIKPLDPKEAICSLCAGDSFGYYDVQVLCD